MNYSKINWSSKSALSKDDLNKMDTGILGCVEAINALGNPPTTKDSGVFINFGHSYKESDLGNPIEEASDKSWAVFILDTIALDGAIDDSTYCLICSPNTNKPGRVEATAVVRPGTVSNGGDRDKNGNPVRFTIYLKALKVGSSYFTQVSVGWVLIGKYVK